jgi:hypothetical protein
LIVVIIHFTVPSVLSLSLRLIRNIIPLVASVANYAESCPTAIAKCLFNSILLLILTAAVSAVTHIPIAYFAPFVSKLHAIAASTITAILKLGLRVVHASTWSCFRFSIEFTSFRQTALSPLSKIEITGPTFLLNKFPPPLFLLS